MKFPAAALRNISEHYRTYISALILNAPLIWIIMLLNLRGVDFTGLTWIYASSVALGYYVFPLFLMASILHMILLPIRGVAQTLARILTVTIVFYLLLDSFVYNSVKIHIDFFWLEFALRDFAGFGLPMMTLFWSTVALLAIIGLQIGIARLLQRYRLAWRYVIVVWVLLLGSFGTSQIIHIFAYYNNDNRITSLTPHFPFYMPFTSHRNAAKYDDRNPLGSAEQDARSAGYEYSSMKYPLGEMRYATEAETPNVVILLLESWRFDAMNETVSPNIHALSRRSLNLRNHMSSGNQTTCGIFSLFYGLHPTYWPAVKANSTMLDNPVLMDRMQEMDYAFGIYANSKFERHKIKDTIFRGIPINEKFQGRKIYDNDTDMNNRAIEFIRQQVAEDRPYMTMIFYKGTHFAYEYPPDEEIFKPVKNIRMGFTSHDMDPSPFLNDYRNAIHFDDRLIGELLAELEALGQMDNTIILVTTDHGEQFNDNGANYWGHGSNFTRYQTQVPLVFYAPGRTGREVHELSSHVDVAPTLLQEFFGCTTDLDTFSNGRNLFGDLSEPRPLVIGSYVNHAFITGDNVFEIYPMYTKKYKLDDINLPSVPPSPDLLKTVIQEINRFYEH
jgi:uncharacterized protein